MSRIRHEHSLRNQNVGEAYMTMLDVYDQCRGRQLDAAATVAAIQAANPYKDQDHWPGKAWRIALREFCRDFDLPAPADLHRPATHGRAN
jgi:hypothetical protein